MSVFVQIICIFMTINKRLLGGSGVWIKCEVRCSLYWGSGNACSRLEHSIDTFLKGK